MSGIIFCSLLSIHEYKIHKCTSRQFGIVQVYLNAAFLGKGHGSGACRKESQQPIFHLDCREKSGEKWLSQWLQKHAAIFSWGFVTSVTKCTFLFTYGFPPLKHGCCRMYQYWKPIYCLNIILSEYKWYWIRGGSNNILGQDKFSGAGIKKQAGSHCTWPNADEIWSLQGPTIKTLLHLAPIKAFRHSSESVLDTVHVAVIQFGCYQSTCICSQICFLYIRPQLLSNLCNLHLKQQNQYP